MSVGVSNQRGARYLLAAVIAAAVFMSNLDLWIVNVAFVAIGHGFSASVSDVSWVLDAYAITLAAVLVPAGRFGDRHGHRPVFLAGVAIFTLASGLCAAAPTLPLLVGARILQAVGAAAQLPSSLALLMAAVAPARRTSAARTWAAVGAVAAVFGPVAGGLLVTVSWRWVFVVNLPIGVLTLLLGLRTLPHPPPRGRDPLPDAVGTVLLVAAVAALTGALVEGPTWGWTSARTALLGAVAVLAGVAFARRTSVHPRPLVEPHLLRVRRFAVANAATAVFSAAFAIMLLGNSLWCQQVWHYSALRTGFALAPGPLMVPFVTALSTRLLPRFGLAPPAAVGSVVFAAGIGIRIATTGSTPAYLPDLLPSMLVTGIGVGLALPSFLAAAATALPAERSATASGTVNSVRQVASALGVALLVTLLSGSGSLPGRFEQAWWVTVGLALLAGAVGLGLHGTVPATPLPAPAGGDPAVDHPRAGREDARSAVMGG